MNCYEHTVITKPDLTDSQSKKLLEKYQTIISKNLGKIIKTEEWGLLTFARNIKNNKKGFYFHLKIEGEGKTIEELEKAENIDDSLIRYLTVKVKKHDLKNVFFEKRES
jgi:small subunit ribosomal protein S6